MMGNKKIAGIIISVIIVVVLLSFAYMSYFKGRELGRSAAKQERFELQIRLDSAQRQIDSISKRVKIVEVVKNKIRTNLKYIYKNREIEINKIKNLPIDSSIVFFRDKISKVK